MITNACDGRQADISALKREPFTRVLDQILRWLREVHRVQEESKKRKR